MKLAKCIFVAPPKVAVQIIDNFTIPFPSLDGVAGKDVVNSVMITPQEWHYGDKGNLRIISSINKIEGAIRQSSCEEQWPAEFYTWEDDPSWCKNLNIQIIPHCGDRIITVKGGILGHGHGEGWSGLVIEIDCQKRPSITAMKKVIEFVKKPENEKYIYQVFWELKEYKTEKGAAPLSELALP